MLAVKSDGNQVAKFLIEHNQQRALYFIRGAPPDSQFPTLVDILFHYSTVTRSPLPVKLVELSLDSTDEEDNGDDHGRQRSHRVAKHSMLQEPEEWKDSHASTAEGMRAPSAELAKLAASLPTVEQLLANGTPEAHRAAQVCVCVRRGVEANLSRLLLLFSPTNAHPFCLSLSLSPSSPLFFGPRHTSASCVTRSQP